MNGWASAEDIASLWGASAPDEADLELINATAIAQLEAFAPAETTDIPAHWVQAQLMQCRNIWNAASSNSSGSIGDGEFSYQPYPLDRWIRGIIRPRRGVPVIA